MTQEEEKKFRKEQIALLNLIVQKLVLIESGMEAMETSIYNGIIKSSNKTMQKLQSQTIHCIRTESENVVRRINDRPTFWKRIKCKYFHYHNRLKRMFKR